VDEAILSLKLQQLQKYIDKEGKARRENGLAPEKRMRKPDLLKH